MKFINALTFITLFLGSSSYCSAQEVLLKGELPNGKSFVLSSDKAEDIHLLYWEDERVPIPLEILPVKDTKINFREKVNPLLKIESKPLWETEDKKNIDLISLTLFEYDGEWKGVFKSEENSRISYKKIDVDKVTHDFANLEEVERLKKEEPFYYLLTSKVLFKTDETENYEGKASVLEDKSSGLQRISFISGYSKKGLLKINARLDSIFFSDLYDHLSLKPAFIALDMDFSISFMNESFIVLHVETTFSGGAHPDFGSDHYVIDIKTGELLYFYDFFKYHKNQEIDKNDQYSFYEDSPAHAIIEDYIGETNYPDDGTEKSDCQYYIPNLKMKNIYPKADGLCIPAKFIRAGRACDNDCAVFIPYKKIKEYNYLNTSYKWPK